MLDIRKNKNGYWWKASEKFDSIIANNKEDKLLELTIQITDRVNMYCNKIHNTNKDMHKDTVTRIIDQACQLGLEYVHFTGCESILHKDFPYIIEYCMQKKLRTDTSSNGKFSKNIGEQLAKSGLNSINIAWDFIDNPPECIDFIFDLGLNVFINHMVMPDNYMELLAFLNYIRKNCRNVIDIQLIPPIGESEKFTTDEILEFEEKMVEKCFNASKKRFPMVSNKIMELLSCSEAEHGIYHHRIKWPCHISKSEIMVGINGFVTCPYLYRDGYVTCGLEKSVRNAWDLCKKECICAPPIKEMCDYSCSTEVAYFNYFIDKEMNNRKNKLR